MRTARLAATVLFFSSPAPGADLGAQIERAYEIALARPPSATECALAEEFVKSSPYGLVDFCQTLFNLNEFVYRQ